MPTPDPPGGIDRRTFMGLCSAAGLARGLPAALPVDVSMAPSFASNLLLITNLTGHPALVVPNGFDTSGGPVSLSFIGRLFGEADLLTVGEAYQTATDFHRRHPQEFS